MFLKKSKLLALSVAWFPLNAMESYQDIGDSQSQQSQVLSIENFLRFETKEIEISVTNSPYYRYQNIPALQELYRNIQEKFPNPILVSIDPNCVSIAKYIESKVIMLKKIDKNNFYSLVFELANASRHEDCLLTVNIGFQGNADWFAVCLESLESKTYNQNIKIKIEMLDLLNKNGEKLLAQELMKDECGNKNPKENLMPFDSQWIVLFNNPGDSDLWIDEDKKHNGCYRFGTHANLHRNAYNTHMENKKNIEDFLKENPVYENALRVPEIINICKKFADNLDELKEITKLSDYGLLKNLKELGWPRGAKTIEKKFFTTLINLYRAQERFTPIDPFKKESFENGTFQLFQEIYNNAHMCNALIEQDKQGILKDYSEKKRLSKNIFSKISSLKNENVEEKHLISDVLDQENKHLKIEIPSHFVEQMNNYKKTIENYKKTIEKEVEELHINLD
jgi:hypothetical protein